ncbi:MAG: IS1380 family transposase, partial [Gammaproteobacteria bacterium]|nr:IS1380 family transposase [Gammaproteobacteria bacterium]
MRQFIIEQNDADLISHAGLGLIGRALNGQTDLGAQAKLAAPARCDAIPHADVLKSYVGLLCLGKSDFEA